MIVLNNELIQKTDCYIDENHQVFSELGKRFSEEFVDDRTQIRNLQQITCSATRFADIEDFVKNQMGKERNESKWRALGDDILKQLEQLRSESEKLDTASATQMALRLRLARGWVRAVVSEYLYQVAHRQMGDTE